MKATVVIPFKSLDEGKSRLAGAMEPGDRYQLCAWMLERTLALVARFPEVIVISDDARARGITESAAARATFLMAMHPRDLNIAIDEARMHVQDGSAMLVLPTDLVCLDNETLTRFLSEPNEIWIAPDRAGTGTNLLYLPPSAVPAFRFSFGPLSLVRHKAEAARLGCESKIFYSAVTGFDLDTPQDLQMLRASNCPNVPLALPV